MAHVSSIGGMDYTYLTVTSCPAVFSHYSRNAPEIAYDGTGSAQHQVADEVVEKIKLPGGDAVANYDSVKQGDAIIKAGVGAMGSPHALERVFGYLRSQRFGRKTIATAPGISTASATQSARL